MEILYLSHCVPNPPDKGEKIRAYHEVRALAREHRVHVACFAKSEREVQQAREMEAWCASVHVELANSIPSLAQAAIAYGLFGSSLNYGYYRSPGMERHVRKLAGRVRLDCAIAYSVVVERYAPAGVPVVLDMIDVDSEKWFRFAESRRPGWFFRTEARRYRQLEIEAARRARVTFLATENERDIFRRIASGPRVEALENGVDSEYYDPAAAPVDGALAGRRFLVFTGAFQSYANIDGAVWFVEEVFPALRAQVDPNLELFLVGMNPAAAVRELGKRPGVTVTGYVADTRPYLAGAAAVVAPLRVARGIQNKVLEGLAMDKPVLVSTEVGKTFGGEVPVGVTVCGADAGDWVRGLRAAGTAGGGRIRAGMVERWAWGPRMALLGDAVAQTHVE